MHYFASLVIITLMLFVYGNLGGKTSITNNDTTPEIAGGMYINGGIYDIYNRQHSKHNRSFSFYPLELLRVKCQSTPEWSIHLFYESERTLISGMSESEESEEKNNKYVMYKIMTDNISFEQPRLTCKLTHKNKPLISTLKVYLIQLEKSTLEKVSDRVVFVVNNLNLYARPSKQNVNNTSPTFVYEYYDGEEVNVTLKLGRRIYHSNNVNCSLVGPNQPNRLFFASEFMFFSLKKNHHRLKLFCQLQPAQAIVNATIMFLYDSFFYEPYLTGLSLSNTLQKYKMNSTVTVIEYEYCEAKKLNLKCATNYTTYELELMFTSYHFSNHGLVQKTANDQGTQIEAVFELAPHVTSTKITCNLLKHEINYYTTILYLIREKSYQDNSNNPECRDEEVTRIDRSTYEVPNSSIRLRYSPFTKSIGSPFQPRFDHETRLEYEGDYSEYLTGSHQEAPAPQLETGTSGYFIIAILGTIVLCIASIGVCVIRARRKKVTRHVYENDVVRLDSITERASIASSNCHIYETIPEEGVPTNPEVHSISTAAEMDISQRPPCPLPQEENEENKPYIHYDTPYDFRIFRIGVPVVQAPDRFRSRRGRF